MVFIHPLKNFGREPWVAGLRGHEWRQFGGGWIRPVLARLFAVDVGEAVEAAVRTGGEVEDIEGGEEVGVDYVAEFAGETGADVFGEGVEADGGY